ncbi:MAG: phytoene desaturase [Bacteroidetes bacterium]|nr:phytoene desaturase [Bacteroidota bacterium]MCW5894437.1 phytoene desaturase [Bacteroidota bacterium]
MMKKIAIIGSGFGGLAEAIRLQSRGYDVTIFEKREKVGGRAYQLVKNGYTFDMGPSLITAPFIIERVFEAAGKRMEDYIELQSLDPFYRIYFHDKSYMDYSGDAEIMKKEMAKFNPADAANYDRFFEDVKPIYDAVITEGLGSTPFLTWKSFLNFVPRALSLGGLTPVYSFASKYFKDERNRFAFSFHPLFIGGSPFRAPSIYIMIPYLEKTAGVWYAKGGMYSLVKAFEQVFLESGGTIRTNAEVSEIVVDNGSTTGVVANGEFHAADAVIANGDVPFTYKNLIKPQHRKKWSDASVDRLHITMSCFLLYIGTKKQYPQLKHHTLILSQRYKELVRDIFERKILADDFSIYLHVPSRSDASMAPLGCESMYLLVPVPHLGSGVDWHKQAGPFKERILNFLENDFGMTDLRANIEVLEMFTPLDFEAQLNSHLGNAFAIEPRLTQSALFRPHNRSEDIERLYFVGAGTHPGGGVPGVLLSAEATEKCVLQDLAEYVTPQRDVVPQQQEAA